MVWYVLIFCPYLEGTLLMIRTDHKFLKWILSLADVISRLVRWHLRLANFEFGVVYHAEFKRQAVEALFRLQTTGADTDLFEDNSPVAVNGADITSSTEMCLERHEQGRAQVIQ